MINGLDEKVYGEMVQNKLPKHGLEFMKNVWISSFSCKENFFDEFIWFFSVCIKKKSCYLSEVSVYCKNMHCFKTSKPSKSSRTVQFLEERYYARNIAKCEKFLKRGEILIYKSVSQVLREGNGNALQYSCLQNPMDGRAWWAAVHGVTKSQIQLKWFSSSSRSQVLNLFFFHLFLLVGG